MNHAAENNCLNCTYSMFDEHMDAHKCRRFPPTPVPLSWGDGKPVALDFVSPVVDESFVCGEWKLGKSDPD
jgi:hypothetical protein